jgi:hypothetical protein
MKTQLKISAFAILIVILFSSFNTPLRKKVPCPKIINNTDCNLIVDFVLFDTPPSCTNPCFVMNNLPMAPGATLSIPCDCNFCNVRVDVTRAGTAVVAAFADFNTTSGSFTGGGCTATGITYNGADFVIN